MEIIKVRRIGYRTQHIPKQILQKLLCTSSAHRLRNSAVISWAKFDHVVCLWTAMFAFFRNLRLSRAILAFQEYQVNSQEYQTQEFINWTMILWTQHTKAQGELGPQVVQHETIELPFCASLKGEAFLRVGSTKLINDRSIWLYRYNKTSV